MTETPLVSIIVPSYNYGRYLTECLDSILSLDGGFSPEIIVVDDASTDESWDLLNQPRYKSITKIRHPQNRGHSLAVETGMRKARGKYLARVDPDDRYRPNFLTTLVPCLEAHPEVGLAYADAAQINEHGNITLERSDVVHGGRNFKSNELVPLLKDNFVCSPTVMARRALWVEALPVPSHLAFHDWWFTLMIARNHDFYFVNEVVADYRIHPANHHIKIVEDGSEEQSVFWLLDHIYASQENSKFLEEQKQKARRDIYSSQYLTLARKYFGLGMYKQARGAYLKATRYRPGLIAHPDVTRQLVGTLLGEEKYAKLKRRLRPNASGTSDP